MDEESLTQEEGAKKPSSDIDVKAPTFEQGIKKPSSEKTVEALSSKEDTKKTNSEKMWKHCQLRMPRRQAARRLCSHCILKRTPKRQVKYALSRIFYKQTVGAVKEVIRLYIQNKLHLLLTMHLNLHSRRRWPIVCSPSGRYLTARKDVFLQKYIVRFRLNLPLVVHQGYMWYT